MDKYGKEYYFQTNKFKEQSKQTCKNKLGVENPMQCEEIKNTSIKNRILNNRFNLPFTNKDNEKILNIINNIYIYTLFYS